MILSDSHRMMLKTHGTMVGRMLMGLLFLFSGVGIIAVSGLENTAAFYDSVGIPMAGLLVYVVVLVKIGAGGALMAGYKTDYAAASLIIFTAIATLVAHMSLEDINLFKNLAIIGGLLYVLAYGAGDGWSLGKYKTIKNVASRSDNEMSGGTRTM